MRREIEPQQPPRSLTPKGPTFCTWNVWMLRTMKSQSATSESDSSVYSWRRKAGSYEMRCRASGPSAAALQRKALRPQRRCRLREARLSAPALKAPATSRETSRHPGSKSVVRRDSIRVHATAAPPSAPAEKSTREGSKGKRSPLSPWGTRSAVCTGLGEAPKARMAPTNTGPTARPAPPWTSASPRVRPPVQPTGSPRHPYSTPFTRASGTGEVATRPWRRTGAGKRRAGQRRKLGPWL